MTVQDLILQLATLKPEAEILIAWSAAIMPDEAVSCQLKKWDDLTIPFYTLEPVGSRSEEEE